MMVNNAVAANDLPVKFAAPVFLLVTAESAFNHQSSVNHRSTMRRPVEMDSRVLSIG